MRRNGPKWPGKATDIWEQVMGTPCLVSREKNEYCNNKMSIANPWMKGTGEAVKRKGGVSCYLLKK